MRKAKDERVRIAAAFFRVSFDDGDNVEEGDGASLTKKSEQTLSKISSSDSDSKSVVGKSRKMEIAANLAVEPDLELAASTLRVESCALQRPLPSESSRVSSSVNNADQRTAEICNVKGERIPDSDTISRTEMRRLSVPVADSERVFTAFNPENLVAEESSVRLQSSSIASRSTHAQAAPIAADKLTHSQLNLLKVPAETSGFREHFRLSKLTEQSSGVQEPPQPAVQEISDAASRSSATSTIRDSFDEKSGGKSGGGRRSTLPLTSADLNQSALQVNQTGMGNGQKSPTFEDILAGTSVNPIRKFSIANAAICSSLAPSLLGAIPGVPNSLLPNGDHGDSNLHRSVTLSNLSTTSTIVSDDGSIGRTRRRLKSFLRLNIAEARTDATWHDADEDYHHHMLHYHHHNHHYHHHHVFPHIHVPTITFTAPATDGTGRKFNFAIRRHSQVVSVNSSTSFLCFRWRSFPLTSVTRVRVWPSQPFSQDKYYCRNREKLSSGGMIY